MNRLPYLSPIKSTAMTRFRINSAAMNPDSDKGSLRGLHTDMHTSNRTRTHDPNIQNVQAERTKQALNISYFCMRVHTNEV
jgi:hypothetical protein